VAISGIIWAVWHLPYSLLYGANGGAAGFARFTLITVVLAIPLSWLRLRSGSVWPCAIFHASWNISLALVFAIVAIRP